MHSTHGAETTHPSYCDRERCIRCGPNLHHSSAATMFFPRQRGTTEAAAVKIVMERLDEVDEATGRQLTHPDEMVVTYDDGRQVRWGVEDFRELAETVLGLHEPASRLTAAS